MTVKTFKLISGEEVVAEVRDKTQDGNYIVSRPRVLILVPINQQQAALQLIPWMYSNPEAKDIEIPISSVLGGMSDAIGEVEKQYQTETSGIQVATPGKSILTG